MQFLKKYQKKNTLKVYLYNMGNNKQNEVPTVFELLVQSLRGGSGMKNKCGGKKGGGKPGKGGK